MKPLLIRYAVFASAACALLLGASRAPAGESLGTEDFLWTLGPDGRSQAFLDRKTGKNLLAPESPPFAEIRRGGKRSSAVRFERRGERFVLSFSEPEATLEFAIREKPKYVVLELVSLSDPSIEEVAFAVLRLRLPGRTSWMSGAAIGSDFAVAVRSLDLRLNLQLSGGPEPLFRPVATSGRGLNGIRVAIVGCAPERLRPALQELVKAEGLPWSPLGGPFALDAEENRGSYVFAIVSEADVDTWIALARKAGLAQIHLLGWEKTLGHYEPRTDLYPRGLEGLREVVARIHAAGLRAGMHILTGGISRNDPFVTPVPDPRLAKDGRFTLAQDIGPEDSAVPILEPPGDLETSWQYSGRSNVIQIDEELIEYTALSEAPNALGGCRRGAFGTRAAPHSKGSAVHHLFAIYNTFQPDENSSLVEEIADKIASLFNACGFDMIYQDGAEGMPGGAYGCARMREEIFRRLRGRVLVEASEWGYLSWPFHSRIGAYDHPNWGLKRFVDLHIQDAQEYRASSLLPCQLGWWAILGPSADHRYELPEEVEYLCAKALAHDMPLSFQGIDAVPNPWNARQDEYLDLIGRYERLRLARAVPEEVLERLRVPGAEFRLERGEGESWRFVPLECLEHKVSGLDDPSREWRVVNRYARQPLRFRIEALYSALPFDHPEGVSLTDPARPGDLEPAGGAQGVTASQEPGESRGSFPSALFRAKSGLASRKGAWFAFRKEFRPPADLSRFGALGVWVRGDGSGALLNFQLTNPLRFWPTWDEHYVDLDFEGWRYFELHLRERDAHRFLDYSWPYGGASAVFRSPLIRTHVSALTLYLNEIAPSGTLCSIGPVRALPVAKTWIENPALEIGGAKVVFPARLQSGQFLEADGAREVKILDERGAFVASVAPEGAMPILEPGENRVVFSARASEEAVARGLRVRALVTIFALGEPLEVPSRAR